MVHASLIVASPIGNSFGGKPMQGSRARSMRAATEMLGELDMTGRQNLKLAPSFDLGEGPGYRFNRQTEMVAYVAPSHRQVDAASATASLHYVLEEVFQPLFGRVSAKQENELLRPQQGGGRQRPEF